MKIVQLTFDEFCNLIPNTHEPNHRSSRYSDCAIAINKNGTSYLAHQNVFYRHFPQIFQSFTDKMFKLRNSSNQIDGNMILEHTLSKYKLTNTLYIIDLFYETKMMCVDLNTFARYASHSGQTIICYSLLGIILFKGEQKCQM